MEQMDQAATRTWRVQLRGLRRLPRRVVFTIADIGRPLWWSTLAGVPTGLLLGAAYSGGWLAYCYSMYCAAMVMVLSQSSERFVDTTVEVDWDAGTLAATYHMGEPSLFAADHEVAASLREVEAARVHSLSDSAMVRLYHGTPLAEATAFPIPAEHESPVRALLRRHDVEIRGEADTGWSDWVLVRSLVTAVVVIAIPIAGVFVWPVPYSWAVLVVLALHAVVLPMQGS